MSFLLCIAKYVVEMVILLAIGLLGAFIGIKLRKHKDAKKTAEATVLADEKNESCRAQKNNFWRKLVMKKS